MFAFDGLTCCSETMMYLAKQRKSRLVSDDDNSQSSVDVDSHVLLRVAAMSTGACKPRVDDMQVSDYL